MNSPYAGSAYAGGSEGEFPPRTFLFSTRRGLHPRLVEKKNLWGDAVSPNPSLRRTKRTHQASPPRERQVDLCRRWRRLLRRRRRRLDLEVIERQAKS